MFSEKIKKSTCINYKFEYCAKLHVCSFLALHLSVQQFQMLLEGLGFVKTLATFRTIQRIYFYKISLIVKHMLGLQYNNCTLFNITYKCCLKLNLPATLVLCFTGWQGSINASNKTISIVVLFKSNTNILNN